jgi:hypothetical protein
MRRRDFPLARAAEMCAQQKARALVRANSQNNLAIRILSLFLDREQVAHVE